MALGARSGCALRIRLTPVGRSLALIVEQCPPPSLVLMTSALLVAGALAMTQVSSGADAPPPLPAHHLRAAIETAALMTIGTVWYWRSPSSQSDDWDLHFDWSSWRRKIDLQAVRFDANQFKTNGISHPISGHWYYHASRDNGLSLAESYLSSFVASTFWEYFIEFRESPSLNDLIMTPAGGTVLGESAFRLGRYFSAGSPSLLNRIGAWLFTPIASLNDLLTGRRTAVGPRAGDHRLFLALGRASTAVVGRPRRDELSLDLGGAIVAHPGYRRPGEGATTVGPGQWSAVGARLLLDRGEGTRGLSLRSSTLFGGRYFKHYSDGLRGWGLLLGLGGSFSYDVRALDPGWDRVASVGLLGPMTELTLDQSWFHLRLSCAAYYSFGLLQSLAYPGHADALAHRTIKTSLRDGGYYYGHGLTTASALRLRLASLELAFTQDLGAFTSLDGRDRFQEKLDHDFSLNDVRAAWSALASVRLFRGPVWVTGRVETLKRRSHLLAWTSHADESRLGLSVTLVSE
jgi:hypothetical protein